MLVVGGPTGLVLNAIDQVMPALKLAVMVRHRPSVSKAVYALLLLLKCDSVETGGLGCMAYAVAPYLNRLLPTLNLYISDKHKVGIDGAYQVAERSMSDLVTEVMEICEKDGPPGVYKVIKYCVATYQSVNI